MSAHTKLRGGSESDLTRLKELWLSKTFSEASRSYWRDQFASARTQAEIRAEIFTKLKIKLTRDNQLNAFRSWLEDQDRRDEQAARAQENERRIRTEHPDWTLDQVRDELLKQSYFETIATGDFKTGLKAVAAHTKVSALEFDREKFKEALRTKLESAFNELATACKGNAAALQHIQKARELIAPQK